MKVTSSSGSASATSSSAGSSYPASAVQTDSSAGSSCRKHISYSSSSGVSSASTAYPSDDRFLLNRKSKRSSTTGSDRSALIDRSFDAAAGNINQRGMLDASSSVADIDDIVMFDKSHLNDCPIISSSSTSHEYLELFAHNNSERDAGTGKAARKRRRKRNALKKRLRRIARYCAPCLHRSDDSASTDDDTSILYTGLNGDLASRYSSFN